MRKWTFSLLTALLLLKASGGVATVRHLCQGILPENSLWIPVGEVTADRVAQNNFDAVLDRLDKLYRGEIAVRGGNLVIERRWTDGTVNAYADQQGGDWIIHMYGGMARHPALTRDGFALVACHELGHHLGGVPKFEDSTWAAVEGEADYYATLKCLRRYFAQEDNAADLRKMKVDSYAEELCKGEHGARGDQEICVRATMAGISMANVLASLAGSSRPKLNTPDPAVVAVTDSNHPPAQCRLDTYFNGALCRVPVGQSLSEVDYHPGSCADSRTYTHGLRPTCWFAP